MSKNINEALKNDSQIIEKMVEYNLGREAGNPIGNIETIEFNSHHFH